MNVIETQRLTLHKPDANCVDDLADFYVSERSAMAGGHVSYSEAVTRAYAMLGHWEHRGYGLFLISEKQSGKSVGMTGPYFPPGRPETEVGWILFDGFERKGYATEAARAAIGYAQESLGWKDVVHYIDELNTSSIAVAERLGAVLDLNAPQPKPDRPCLVYRQP